ncbi:MAG: helix-turn-helix domain-containing protein [Betaproteobacteria bacterium]|nr:helix-turn-helix domain-containing protein [Betaproteobacteria bacterium]
MPATSILYSTQSEDEAFLVRLGERVRTWRDGRRITRKTLAQASGVSERYLAQLESGQGNMSILLLRQLAQAMQIPLEDLVRETPGTPRRNRIALVGLRGAGKSTLGEKLAAELDTPFIELDREIEREAGTTLAELFGMYGQEGFRRYERRALERVLIDNPRCVIATGGSLVTAQETYERLLSSCFTVWLKAAPAEHMARVVAQGDMRPIHGRAAAMDDLEQLLSERRHLYARADVAVDTAGRTLRTSLADLRKHTTQQVLQEN